MIDHKISGENVLLKLMQYPHSSSISKAFVRDVIEEAIEESRKEKGYWEPVLIHTYNGIDNLLEARESFACSRCGFTVHMKYDWCTCGADMREDYE